MANVCKAIGDIKKDAFEEGRGEFREEECRNIVVRMIKAGKVSLEDIAAYLALPLADVVEISNSVNEVYEPRALMEDKSELDNEIAQLKRELSAAKDELARVKRGGRYKDYEKSIKWSNINRKIHHQLFGRLPRRWASRQPQFRKHWWSMV